VINGLTDLAHPCQALADLFTLKELAGPLQGQTLAFVGDANNVAHSLAEGCGRMGMKLSIASPQAHVREQALARGIRVYVPTPRLKGGFHLLDPDRIPAHAFRQAATMKTMARWAQPVALDDLPQLDAIVTGSAAVTAGGKRAGKGEGYSDLEFAILRELGFDPVPVATTVHDVQVVEDFPIEANDIPLSVICTPTRTLVVAEPPPAPAGIDWSRLDEQAQQAMPILEDLRSWQRSRSRGGAL
jgi:5-formyltetrahydrofolate cyclo-ligase